MAWMLGDRRAARVLVVLVLALWLTLAALAVRPHTASAGVNPNVVGPLTKARWVYVEQKEPAAAYRVAWVYRGGGFSHAVWLPYGTPVYVYPYDGRGWMWAYSRRHGWTVMRADDLDTGYSCTGPACPVF